ncbi:MAG TPA: polymer-forming cytoskeletal protein [Candidatus Methylacidiphilales bacterium]|nr:polymer-forming cytoskeletal protein [Candidatus Methylacidiphilales bacterium]
MPDSKNSAIEIHSGLMLKGRLSMVRDVVLTGRFEGDLQTRGRLTVAAGGIAIGTIEAGALQLEPGNEVQAKVKIGRPEQPKILDAVKKIGGGKWSARLRKLKEFAFGSR